MEQARMTINASQDSAVVDYLDSVNKGSRSSLGAASAGGCSYRYQPPDSVKAEHHYLPGMRSGGCAE